MNFNTIVKAIVVSLKILCLMCLVMLKAEAASCNFARAIKSPKLGDKIYLNGCGPNPMGYFTSP
jgi:hypothetical protein